MDFFDLSLTPGRLCLHLCELWMVMKTVLWEWLTPVTMLGSKNHLDGQPSTQRLTPARLVIRTTHRSTVKAGGLQLSPALQPSPP